MKRGRLDRAYNVYYLMKFDVKVVVHEMSEFSEPSFSCMQNT